MQAYPEYIHRVATAAESQMNLQWIGCFECELAEVASVAFISFNN